MHVEQIIRQAIEDEYNNLKNESGTYEELERRIKAFSKELIFRDSRVGMCVKTIMEELLHKDTGNVSIR